jgi:hypothetical protein
MSDHNFRDRHSPKWQPSADDARGPHKPEAPTARPGAPAARTVVGAPGAGPPVARPGLSGRTPGQPEDPITLTGVAPPSEADRDGRTPDTLYMDAPSEIMIAAQTPTPSPKAHVREPGYAATTPPPPPPPPQSPYNASAPESWRSAARNVAERSKKSTRANPKSDSQHLRLKLDGDSYDDFYRGVPKSRLPVVVLAFLLLLAAAGGGAYWAQDHGGLAALAARLHLTLQEKLATEPTADQQLGSRNEGVAANAQPAAVAAAPTGADTMAQPGAAPAPQLPAAAPAQQPAKAAAPGATEAQAAAANRPSDTNARSLADPEMPGAEPPGAAEASKAAPAKAPVASKPAARRAPPARPVIRHDPVIQIRNLGGSSTPGAPPEPSGTPYVPAVPIDPPAPDEPR